MAEQKHWQSVVESVGGTAFRTLLQVLVMFFILYPLSGLNVSLWESITTITPLMLIAIPEIYLIRRFFVWLWGTKKV